MDPLISYVGDPTFLSRHVLSTSIVSTICFALIGGYFYYQNKHSYWKRKNINGPKPNYFFGNTLTILSSNRLNTEKEWPKKYGKVYGIYQGTKPQLIVADPEVLQQICIKDFDAFTNHETTTLQNKFQKKFLIFLQDEHWKKVRALMSPTFTSGKIKRMFRFLDKCADDLVDCFDEQITVTEENGEKTALVNVKDLYSLFTMDAVTTCLYGIKLEREGSANLKSAASRNEFVRMAMSVFYFSYYRVLTIASVPKPILNLFGFKSTPTRQYKQFADTVQQLIDNRRKSPKKFDDYLQLLIDAKLEDQMELNEMDQEENHHAGLTRESLIDDQNKMVNEIKTKDGDKVTMTDLEILTNGVFLLAVGLETTASLLCHTSYILAFHQDEQAKLHEELLKIVEYDGDKSRCTFNYEALTSCHYLDAVISESLRRLSPVLQLDRVANRDYKIEKYNVDIPKGSRIFNAYYAVMNDPDYWDEPEKFNPERFMPENKHKIVPGSYCPFGLGPRHCIGMRFSLTEAKLALAKIMMNFKFVPAPDTAFPPETKRTIGITQLKLPVVKIIPRQRLNQ